MPAVARMELESLLRARKLDHTLAGRLSSDPGDARWMTPTGLADLDRLLRGGFPRGQLSEIVGPRSSGRMAVLVASLAAATGRGEAVALVDPLDLFDPPSAAASGVDFSRLLWVRGESFSSGRTGLASEYGTLQTMVDRGVKALNLILQAGGFGLVAFDLAEVAPQVVGRIPFTTWLRLHRVIEGSETACLLIGGQPIARSAAGLTIALGRDSGLGSRESMRHGVPLNSDSRTPNPGLGEAVPNPDSRPPNPEPGEAVPSPDSRSPNPDLITVRVIRARTLEAGRDVCLSVSPAIA